MYFILLFDLFRLSVLIGFAPYSYSERLLYLGLTSLGLRRLHLDLIFCYKIVFGIVNVSFSSFFRVSLAQLRTLEVINTSCINHIVVMCEYSNFRIESNSYFSIRFDSKRVQIFEIFEYLPSPISYLFKQNDANFSP